MGLFLCLVILHIRRFAGRNHICEPERKGGLPKGSFSSKPERGQWHTEHKQEECKKVRATPGHSEERLILHPGNKRRKVTVLPDMLSMQEVMQRLLALLSRTSYSREQIQSYVNRLEETFKWEGVPYVDIGERNYVVTIYERGVPSLIKRLENVHEVLYWLLEDILFTASHVNLLQKYGVDNVNTHLDYTSEVWQEIEDDVRAAFQAIGDPYLTWHQNGKRRELETVQPRKGNLQYERTGYSGCLV